MCWIFQTDLVLICGCLLYLQRYSSFSVRNGTAEISLPFAKLSSFQSVINWKQLRELEVQMVSAISFGLFADFGKTLTIIQHSSQPVYSDKRLTTPGVPFISRQKNRDAWSQVTSRGEPNFLNKFPESFCSIWFWTGNFGRMERALSFPSGFLRSRRSLTFVVSTTW